MKIPKAFLKKKGEPKQGKAKKSALKTKKPMNDHDGDE